MTRRIRQVFIGIGILLGLVSVLVVGFLFYLRTGHALRLIQAKVNETIPGTISCQEWSYSLFNAEFELRNVELKDPSGDNLAGFERLFVDLSWTSLFRGNLRVTALVLEKPWATIQVDTDGQVNLTRAFSGSKPDEEKPTPQERDAILPNIVLESVELVRGYLRYDLIESDFHAEVHNIDLAGDANFLQRSGKLALQVGKIDLAGPAIRTQLNRLDLRALLKGGRIEPFILQTGTSASGLTLAGDIRDVFHKPVIDLALDLTGSLSELSKILDLQPDLTGQMEARLTARGALHNPELILHLDYGGGRVAGREVGPASLDCHLEDRRLTLDNVHVDMASGGLNVHGEADLKDAFPKGFLAPERDLGAISYEVFLNQEEMKLEQLTSETHRFYGTAQSKLSLYGRGVSPQTLSATAVIEVLVEQLRAGQDAVPLDCTLKSEVSLAEGVVALKAFEAETGNTKVRANGRFNLSSGEMSAKLTLDAPHLSHTLPSLGVGDARGALRMEAHVSGSTEKPSLDCTLQGERLRFQDITIGNVQLIASLDRSGILHVSQLSLENQGSSIRGGGMIQVFEDSLELAPDLPLSFSLALRHIEAKDFLRTGIASGTINGELKLDGNIKAMKGDLSLRGEGLATETARLGDLDLDLRFSDGTFYLDRAEVRNQNSAFQVSGAARMFEQTTMRRLEDPTFHLNLEGEAVFIEDFVDQLKGRVSLTAHLQGSVTRPEGTLKLHGTDLDLGIQRLSELTLHSRLDAQKIWLDRVQIVVVPGEEIKAEGWVSFQKAYDVTLVSKGISFKNIDKVRELKIADGKILLDISGAGSLADPRVQGNIDLRQLRIKGKALDDCALRVDVRDQVASISGKLNFDLNGSFHLRNKDFSASILCDETDLAPYFRISGHPDLHGMLTGRIEARGNATAVDQIEAVADIWKLSLFFKDEEVIHTKNFKVSFVADELTVSPTHFVLCKEGGIDIQGKGKRNGPLAFQLEGRIPLRLVNLFSDDLGDVTGDLLLSGNVGGTEAHPDLRGEIELKEIGFTIPALSQKLHHLNGRLQIAPQAVRMDRIEGQLGSGRFDLAGRVDLEALEPVGVLCKFTANALPLQVPDTMDLLLNTELEIQGTTEQSTVKGEIIILEGTYYRDVNLSLLQAVRERKREEAPPPKEMRHPLLKNMTLNISIKRRNPFLVDNNLAELEISPDLRVTGKPNNPIIRGRVSVDSGTVHYRNKNFVVKKGVIDFLNPYKTEPTIDIQSEVKIRHWMILLAVSGTPEELLLKLTSDPPEEDGDILSLLVLGATTRELIDGEGGTSKSTSQMLAEVIASRYGEDFKTATGLDILETEIQGEEGQETSDLKVTAGKKLSKRMIVKYAVESKDGEMIQKAIAEYKFLENILVNGFQDSKGIFGGELQFRLEFR